MSESLPYLIPLLVQLIKYFLFAGIPFLIFYKLFPQFFAKNKIQSRLAKNKDFIREILYSIQTIFIIVSVALIVFKTPIKDSTQLYGNISDYPIWWFPLSIVVGLIIHDTYFYWMHRTIHHPKIYKVVHFAHHKSINPSPWASYAFHFIESFLEALILPILAFCIPMHPVALLLFGFASFAINVYGHLGYEIFPKIFRRTIFFEIFNTSIHHNMHHSKFNYNFGLYFRVWDRLMGTEHADYVKEYDRIQAIRFESSK